MQARVLTCFVFVLVLTFLTLTISPAATAGTMTAFPLPHDNSAPYGITSGPDGNLWFVETFGNKVGRITPS